MIKCEYEFSSKYDEIFYFFNHNAHYRAPKFFIAYTIVVFFALQVLMTLKIKPEMVIHVLGALVTANY